MLSKRGTILLQKKERNASEQLVEAIQVRINNPAVSCSQICQRSLSVSLLWKGFCNEFFWKGCFCINRWWMLLQNNEPKVHINKQDALEPLRECHLLCLHCWVCGWRLSSSQAQDSAGKGNSHWGGNPAPSSGKRE